MWTVFAGSEEAIIVPLKKGQKKHERGGNTGPKGLGEQGQG